MNSINLALSTPRDFLRYRAVLLSAPTDMRRYERAVQPATDFQPLQCLFGYDAQLQAFATALRRVGLEPWFVPAPDVYASTYAFAHLLNTFGEEVRVPGMVLHLCFGMPWAARILKGATNLAVLAGVANEASLHLGYHPFGSEVNFPAAIDGVLTYNRLQSPVRTSDGRDLPTCTLDEAFADEILSGLHTEAVLDQVTETRLRAEFRISSVLEFTAAAWEEKPPGTRTQSLDFRRALIRRNVALPSQNSPLRFSLLPWNMANGRSIVPDIAVRLSSDRERSEYEHGIILVPFNESNTGILRLQALVNECRANAASGCAETVFLLRVTSMLSIPTLKSIITNCWLDGSDPEWRWNARRLSRMGFKTLLIHERGTEESFEKSLLQLDIETVFPAEESCVTYASDGLGGRYWQSHTVSPRGMRGLLQYTRRVNSARAHE